jgi:hypothetical protein
MTGDSSGINHKVTALVKLALPILTVSRQAGNIRNDSVPGSSEAIEQGRFAHVGATNERNDRFHANDPMQSSSGTNLGSRLL